MSWLTDEDLRFCEMQWDAALSQNWRGPHSPSGTLCPFSEAPLSESFKAHPPITPDSLLCFSFVHPAL